MTLSFKRLADVFARLEETSSSLKMIDMLAEFFKGVSPDDARVAAYLLRGEVAPPYARLEVGLAKKLVMRSIAKAVGKKVGDIQKAFAKQGDLGKVAQEFLGDTTKTSRSLQEIFDELKSIAFLTGASSQEEKISRLALLISRSSAVEARYIVRLVLGTLRLGVGEMTFLCGLSKALGGSKEGKKVLEHAFNVLSDLGEVAWQAVKHGVDALKDAKPVPGVPLRMMLAKRIEELKEVKKHIPGELVVEYKYDGERIQAHLKKGGETVFYSRRHENITRQFPDVQKALKASFEGREAIVEGEVVAIEQKTGKLKDFQTLMTRRRKYNIEEYVKKVPVKYFLFDLIFLDGKSLLHSPLLERQEYIKNSFAAGKDIEPAKALITSDIAQVQRFFSQAMTFGAEGIMVKDAKSFYEAGTRGWKWIKFKKEYKGELAYTFDLVVVGGIHGTGRRGGTYGSLLVGAFDPKTNRYYSFTKVGTGLTDEDLEKLPKLLNKYRVKEKHRLVETRMEADVWFEPAVVMEVAGSEITVSPVHTVARDTIKKGGLALRFPRFLRWREDKSPEQATTVKEIYQLYEKT